MLPNSDRAFRDQLYKFWESISPDAKRSDSFKLLEQLLYHDLGFDTESRVVSRYSESLIPTLPKIKKDKMKDKDKDSGISRLVASLSARVANLSTTQSHYSVCQGCIVRDANSVVT